MNRLFFAAFLAVLACAQAAPAWKPPLPDKLLSLPHVTLEGIVTDAGVQQIADDLLTLQQAGHLPVLWIYSPGGSAPAGLWLHQELEEGNLGPVVCVVDKLAASAAAVILAGCPVRVVIDGARIMHHHVGFRPPCSSFFPISIYVPDLVKIAAEGKALDDVITWHIAQYLGISFEELNKREAKAEDGELWWTTREAFDQGLVHYVLAPLPEQPEVSAE